MYIITVKKGATKALDKAPKNVRDACWAAISKLADDPRPHGCVKLKNDLGYRIRVGEWRVIYTIEDKELLILIVRVGPRGGVY